MATIFTGKPSSSAMRVQMESVSPAYPKTSPLCIEATVFLPTTLSGFSKATRGSLLARWKSASIEMAIPGAMAPPRYSPRGVTASKVVAVPKSTMIKPWGHLS